MTSSKGIASRINLIIFLLLILLTPSCMPNPYAHKENYNDLSNVFQNYIPEMLGADLKLVELTRMGRTPLFPRSREVNVSKTEKKLIYLDDGYRAMYSYPGTDFFANVKIEKSAGGQYLKNKEAIIANAKLIYEEQKKGAEEYLQNNPQKMAALDSIRVKDKPLYYFDHESNDIEYLSYGKFFLDGNTLNVTNIFVPSDEIFITIYMLNQKNRKFRSIEEFLNLKNETIGEYINYLQRHRKSDKSS
jgi:hypothetical protein